MHFAHEKRREMEPTKVYNVPLSESDSMVDILRKSAVVDDDDILAFFSSTSLPRSLARQARCIKIFCERTPLIEDDADQDKFNATRPYHGQHPIAWVSDANWQPNTHDSIGVSHNQYGQVLSNKELCAILRTSRVFQTSDNISVGPARRIYINKPNGRSVLALIRNAPPSQVPGLRELLVNYITGSPKPIMSSREIFWWGSKCFIFSFNLPFFAISAQSKQDTRTFSHEKLRLRSCYDLSFLHLGASETDPYFSEEPDPSDHDISLLEGVCSVVVTGQSKEYWTAVCLNDDLYDGTDEPRLSPEDDMEQLDEIDPIVLKMANNPKSPRAYALAALETGLVKVVDCHKDIQDAFRTSLNLHIPSSRHSSSGDISSDQMQEWASKYPEALERVMHCNQRIVERLEHFLSHHLMVCPEGLPQHKLWLNVNVEERATQSLIDITDSLESLRDVQSELTQLFKSLNELRHEDMQKSKDINLHRMTLAALATTILNLVPQTDSEPTDATHMLSFLRFEYFLWIAFIACLLPWLLPSTVIPQHLAQCGENQLSCYSNLYRASQKQRNWGSRLMGFIDKASIATRDQLRLGQFAALLRKATRDRNNKMLIVLLRVSLTMKHLLVLTLEILPILYRLRDQRSKALYNATSSCHTQKMGGVSRHDLQPSDSARSLDIEAAEATGLVPINELPRRKVVWVWVCCQCGTSGMKVSVDPCPCCGNYRCPNCATRRFG
ncbi:hypothetical protein AU210_001613 [Fusarium oxysporum f. sp. radicis-cucumerinum]|uniref:Uncharacterized protein n=1 Tax=Fusarium oxysporum f. sp. radicis-cucumerinum TaxID=327505 RepID=A0A2H3I7I9_FUSOX|nr:hypothetical protein AU210_001613 [Fusarium oxysporum f. sp. radicis-cucumerinum]